MASKCRHLAPRCWMLYNVDRDLVAGRSESVAPDDAGGGCRRQGQHQDGLTRRQRRAGRYSQARRASQRGGRAGRIPPQLDRQQPQTHRRSQLQHRRRARGCVEPILVGAAPGHRGCRGRARVPGFRGELRRGWEPRAQAGFGIRVQACRWHDRRKYHYFAAWFAARA